MEGHDDDSSDKLLAAPALYDNDDNDDGSPPRRRSLRSAVAHQRVLEEGSDRSHEPSSRSSLLSPDNHAARGNDTTLASLAGIVMQKRPSNASSVSSIINHSGSEDGDGDGDGDHELGVDAGIVKELAVLREDAQRVVDENEQLRQQLLSQINHPPSLMEGEEHGDDLPQIHLLLSEVTALNQRNAALQGELDATKAESRNQLRESVGLNAELAHRTQQLKQLERDLNDLIAIGLPTQQNVSPQHTAQSSTNHELTASQQPPSLTVAHDGRLSTFGSPRRDRVLLQPDELKDPRAAAPTTEPQHFKVHFAPPPPPQERRRSPSPQRIDASASHLERLEAEIERVRKENSDLHTALARKNKDIHELKVASAKEHAAAKASITEELEVLTSREKEKILFLESTVDEKEKACDALLKSVERLSQENANLRSDIEGLQATPREEVEELTQINAQLMASLVEAQRARDDALLLVEQNSAQLHARTTELEQVKTDALTKSESYEERLRRADVDNSMLREKILSLSGELVRTNEKVARLEQDRKRAEFQFSAKSQAVQEQAKQAEAEFKRKAQQLAQQSTNLREDLEREYDAKRRESDAKISEAQRDATRASQQVEAMQTELHDREKEVACLRYSLEDANRQIALAQRVIDEDAFELEKLQSALESLQTKHRSAIAQIHSLMQREGALNGKLRDVRAELMRQGQVEAPLKVARTRGLVSATNHTHQHQPLDDIQGRI